MSKVTAPKGKKKIDSSLDKISDTFVTDLEKIIGGSLPAEMKVFNKACTMIEKGLISIRGLRSSIEKANLVGALPTIKPAHSQDFIVAKSIRSLNGGADESLKTLLNTAHQAKKHFNGKDGKMSLVEALDFVESFKDLSDSIPSQGEKAKRKARTEGDKVEKPATVEQLIKALGAGLKAKPVLKGQALKDAEALAVMLAQTLTRSRGSKGAPAKGAPLVKVITDLIENNQAA